MFVTHGVFGSGLKQAFARLNTQEGAKIAALAERYEIDFLESPSDLLLTFAFSNNPGGVVITSMYDMGHIEHNAASARQAPIPGFASAVRQSLGTLIS
jgi:aryl-alcohol dehydrogenase-like predicted oxidoreductase